MVCARIIQQLTNGRAASISLGTGHALLARPWIPILHVFKYATQIIYLPFLSRKELTWITFRFSIFKSLKKMGYFFLFVNHTFVWFSPLRFSPAQGGQHFSAPDQIEITNASSQEFHFYVFFRGFSF